MLAPTWCSDWSLENHLQHAHQSCPDPKAGLSGLPRSWIPKRADVAARGHGKDAFLVHLLVGQCTWCTRVWFLCPDSSTALSSFGAGQNSRGNIYSLILQDEHFRSACSFHDHCSSWRTQLQEETLRMYTLLSNGLKLFANLILCF